MCVCVCVCVCALVTAQVQLPRESSYRIFSGMVTEVGKSVLEYTYCFLVKVFPKYTSV